MTQLKAAFVLDSPLPGYIYPRGSSWSGGAFGVVSTLAEHIASGRGKGTDIANFPTTEGAPVRLMRAGSMYESYRQTTPGIGYGALIRRFQSPEGDHGYAHLRAFSSLVFNRTYPAGTVVGWVGKTGTTNPHLHTHWRWKSNLLHVEVYNLLEQNHSIQFNANTSGVNIRLAAGLAGTIYAVATTAGIIRKSDGARLGDHDTLLKPRVAVSVVKDGYEWLPRLLGTKPVWVARPFVHFV